MYSSSVCPNVLVEDLSIFMFLLPGMSFCKLQSFPYNRELHHSVCVSNYEDLHYILLFYQSWCIIICTMFYALSLFVSKAVNSKVEMQYLYQHSKVIMQYLYQHNWSLRQVYRSFHTTVSACVTNSLWSQLHPSFSKDCNIYMVSVKCRYSWQFFCSSVLWLQSYLPWGMCVLWKSSLIDLVILM